MSFHSNDPAIGDVAIPKPRDPLQRRNQILDVLTLPVVLVTPRRTVEALGARIPLHYEFRRWTWRTERAVEIALARHVLRGHDLSRVLEVGNVLQLAGITGQTVVDKYEHSPGVINEDILEFSPERSFDLGISISTLEHVGFDEEPPEPGKAFAGLQHLGMLADDLLVTIPVGYNRLLEERFAEGPFDRVELLVKVSRLADWEARPVSEAPRVRYGDPYGFGNGILVGSRGLVGY